MWTSEKFSSLEDKLNVRARGLCNGGSFSLIGICQSGEEKTVYTAELSGAFDISYTFDPVSLGVYQGIVRFYAAISGDCKVDGWEVSGIEVSPSSFADSSSRVRNGKVPVKHLDGSVSEVSVIPKKVVFAGNSLLLGMFGSYGMCATDDKHDYAYLVKQAILQRSPDCSFSKLYSSPVEHSESRADLERWFYTDPNLGTKRPACESFTQDLDLITWQLMDNVNTPAKVAAFRENLPELIRLIKSHSPNARMIWIYGWYMKPEILDLIEDTCRQWGIETLNIESAHTPDNRSYSGQISIMPSGEQTVVKDLWITHPGNSGMAAIADMMIKKIFGEE